MKYRVEIARGACCGTSNCMEAAPEAYEIDESGLARVRPGCPDEEQYLVGARECPVEAILVFDAQTGQKVYP